MYHWLGTGLKHNVRSGGIKAVLVHFQVSENKDRRYRAPQVCKYTPNARFYPSSSLILATFLDSKSS